MALVAVQTSVNDHTQQEAQPFGRQCVLHKAPSVIWKGISDYLHQPTFFTMLRCLYPRIFDVAELFLVIYLALYLFFKYIYI